MLGCILVLSGTLKFWGVREGRLRLAYDELYLFRLICWVVTVAFSVGAVLLIGELIAEIVTKIKKRRCQRLGHLVIKSRCTRCGVRCGECWDDDLHDWNGCICRECKAYRHTLGRDCVCSRCGLTVHRWIYARCPACDGRAGRDIEITSCETGDLETRWEICWLCRGYGMDNTKEYCTQCGSTLNP